MRLLCSGRFQPEGTANFTVCILPPSSPTWEFICCFSPPPPLPQSSPQGQSSLLCTPETIRKCTIPGAEIGAVLGGENDRPGQRPPHLLISPCPGVSGNPHCARPPAFLHQAQQMAPVSRAVPLSPSLAPPRGRSLAGLKRKQMFSSFLDLACDLQFSRVPT